MASSKRLRHIASAAASVFFLFGTVSAEQTKADFTAMMPEALAEHLVLKAGGFKLDETTQEGGTVLARQTQDELQKICSGGGRAALDADGTAKVVSLAKASIVKPDGGIKLGDWQAGEAVAQSGYGFRVGHKDDDHSKKSPGGNCYACHQLDPKEIAYGTIGPSLKHYGKLRGNSEQIVNYTYEVIFNPHGYFPCSHMPRFGANGVLTAKQISDVLAYLLDPASPVNK